MPEGPVGGPRPFAQPDDLHIIAILEHDVDLDESSTLTIEERLRKMTESTMVVETPSPGTVHINTDTKDITGKQIDAIIEQVEVVTTRVFSGLNNKVDSYIITTDTAILSEVTFD